MKKEVLNIEQSQEWTPEDVKAIPVKERMAIGKRNMRKALKHVGMWDQEKVVDFFNITNRQATNRMTYGSWINGEVTMFSKYLLPDDKAQLFNPKGFHPQTNPKDYEGVFDEELDE